MGRSMDTHACAPNIVAAAIDDEGSVRIDTIGPPQSVLNS